MRYDDSQVEHRRAGGTMDAKVLLSQVLHFAVMFASSLLLGLSLWRVLSKGQERQDDVGNMLAVVSVGLGVAACIAAIIIPRIYRQQTVRQIASMEGLRGVERADGDAGKEEQHSLDEQLVSARMIETILTGAILEAPCVLTVVGAFLNAPRWIVVVPLVMVVMMLLKTPRKRAIDDWLQQTKRDIRSGLA